MKTLSLMCCLLVSCCFQAFAEEEVTSFTVSWKNATFHGVADLDAEKSWMAHHIFPSKLAGGMTIARDEKKDIEVFRPDNHGACYARPITWNTRLIDEFRSVMQVIGEHDSTMDFGNAEPVKEYLECSGDKLQSAQLGKVAHVCKNAPIYALRKVTRAKREIIKKAACFICLWCGRKRKRSALKIDGCQLKPRLAYIKTCHKEE